MGKGERENCLENIGTQFAIWMVKGMAR